MTDLELKYKKLNIDYSNIGFYDSTKFVEIEKTNPTFLESYAQYVLEKQYSDEYFKKAEIEIPIIANMLNEELKKDGRLGACIDMSIALCRILEREGYWNYMTKGSLTLDFPNNLKINPKYLWSIDFGNFQAGHAWIVAPPFTVVDSALRQQLFKEGEEKYIPDILCTKSKTTTSVQEIDIISPEASRYLESIGINSKKLEYCNPNFERFIYTFKPVKYINNNKVVFKYFTMAISAPDKPLEEVGTLRLNGKLAIEIYNEIIKPRLIEVRKTT